MASRWDTEALQMPTWKVREIQHIWLNTAIGQQISGSPVWDHLIGPRSTYQMMSHCAAMLSLSEHGDIIQMTSFIIFLLSCLRSDSTEDHPHQHFSFSELLNKAHYIMFPNNKQVLVVSEWLPRVQQIRYVVLTNSLCCWFNIVYVFMCSNNQYPGWTDDKQ